MTIYFTSDTHYGHAKIIQYSKRPFKSVQEMDEALIENYNKVVKQGDQVYHLGDFSFADPTKYFNKLNGQKHLILGNHDDFRRQKVLSWNWIKNSYDLKFDRNTIVLYHYGQRVWNKMHHGAYHAYGHSHGTLPPHGRSCDVGVDCWNYTPVSLEELTAHLDKMPLVTGFAEGEEHHEA